MKLAVKHVNFDYTVRVSRRAKRLQIRINPFSEVEVVLPAGMARCRVAPFLNQHHNWIMKTRARLLAAQAVAPQVHGMIPEQIQLQASDSVWYVSYRQAHENHLGARRKTAGRLEINLQATDEKVARNLLQRWLSREAKKHLVPWLAAVSREHGLAYGRVSIRAQRTRWGSCSTAGAISLNRALMFLQPALVRYLFIHELCHTVHMDHSECYWALVARHEADFRNFERQLTRASTLIPRWAVTGDGHTP